MLVINSWHLCLTLCDGMFQVPGGEEGPGRPEMSSPPPWLRNKVQSGAPPDSGGPPSAPPPRRPAYHVETEFPATNTSPKMKHVAPTLPSPQRACMVGVPVAGRAVGPTGSARNADHPATHLPGVNRQAAVHLVRCPSCTLRPAAAPAPCSVCASQSAVSPGLELLQLADSFNEQFVVQDGSLPHLAPRVSSPAPPAQDGAARPVSHAFSAASTVSLNELLERELDELDTPNDDGMGFDVLTATGDTTPIPDIPGQPIRDCDPDGALSKASSSQSESSLLSQQPADRHQGVATPGHMAGQSSPKSQRPDSLAVGQDRLCKGSEGQTRSEPPTPTPDSQIADRKPCSPSKGSLTHKLHYTAKSKSAKNLSCKEHHPIKLYTVLSPPGLYSDVLERFKKVPPKVKSKPSLAMCLKVQCKEEDGPLPQVEAPSRCDPGHMSCLQENADSGADPMTSSSSSGSPDSAMQQSFSSSSSDNTLSDKPSCRDDGYLSNSTISMSSNDLVGDIAAGQRVRRRAQPPTPGADLHQLRRRSQPQVTSDSPPAVRPEEADQADKSKSLPAGLKLGPGSSPTDLHVAPGTATPPFGKVRDIKAFFECQAGSPIQPCERPPTVGRCQQDQHRRALAPRTMQPDNRSKGEPPATNDQGAPPATNDQDAPPATRGQGAPPTTNVQGATTATRGQGASPATRGQGASPATNDQGAPPSTRGQGASPATNDQGAPPSTRGQGAPPAIRARYVDHQVDKTTGCTRKWREPRLRRCWSDTTIHQCTMDVHRDENRSLQTALRRDWARYIRGPARAHSLPLNRVQRRRSVSPRLLPRRGQRSQGERHMGEGAEDGDHVSSVSAHTVCSKQFPLTPSQ